MSIMNCLIFSTEYAKLKEGKLKMKEDIRKQQIEQLRKDVGKGKSVDLFSTPAVREQTVFDQLHLGDDNISENDEIETEEIDLDEEKEYDSFQRFLHSQGLKQTDSSKQQK